MNGKTTAMGRALLDPAAILEKAGLGADQSAADFGAGALGHFAFAASAIVGPGGRVYAVDILKSSLESIASRARHDGLPNVLTVWGDIERANGVAIDPGTLHLIVLANNVQLALKSPALLGEAKRLLVPGGRLLFVGWEATGARFGVPVSKQVDPDAVARAAVRAGFAERTRFRAGPHHWAMLFERLASPPSIK